MAASVQLDVEHSPEGYLKEEPPWKRRRSTLSHVSGKVGGDAPGEIKASPGEMAAVDTKASPGEVAAVDNKASPAEVEMAAIETKSSPGLMAAVENKASAGEGKLHASEVKQAAGEASLGINVLGPATVEPKTSSPKRGLSESDGDGVFNGVPKRTRSCEDDNPLGDSPIKAELPDLDPEDFGIGQALNRDVMTLTRNFSTPGEIKASPGEVTAIETEASPGKVADVFTKASPGEMADVFTKASPGEMVAVETKSSPGPMAAVENKALAVDGKLPAVEVKQAAGEVSLEIKVLGSPTVEQKTSSPKRGLSESDGTGVFNGVPKRTRSWKVEVLKDSPMKAEEGHVLHPEDFGVVQAMHRDVLTLKRNISADLGKDDFFNQLVTTETRSSDTVVAQSPREVFTLARTIRGLTKLKNITEKRLERRELTANIRDLRQDQRDVRQDQRDVRQDNRDLHQEQTRFSLTESKRQLDICWDKYNVFKASCEPKSEGKQNVETKSEEGKQNVETKSEDKSDDKFEHKDPTSVLSVVDKGLDKAESIVNLGGRAVDLGEKAADVASRAGNLGTSSVANSTKLQAFLGAVVTSASTLARQAFKEMHGGGDDDDGGASA